MKCRVCGYDLDPNRAYCDMCGTKVIDPAEASAAEAVPKTRPSGTPVAEEVSPREPEELFAEIEPIQTESYAHIPEAPATRAPYEPQGWWAPAPVPSSPPAPPVQSWMDAPRAAAYSEPELEFYNEPVFEPIFAPLPKAEPVVAPEPFYAPPVAPEPFYAPPAPQPVGAPTPPRPVPPAAPQPLPSQPAVPPEPVQPVAPPAKTPAQSNEFSWNIYDFPQLKQPEDISIQWPEYDAAEARAEINEPSEGKIREAMEKKQPVVMVSSDVSEGFIAFPDGADATWKEPMAESTKQAERFFTFQKKNEEFQRLLDMEYEKLKSRKKGDDYREEQFRMPQEDMQMQRSAQIQAQMQAQQARNMQGFVPSPMYRQPAPPSPAGYRMPPAPVLRAENLSDFERMLMENTKDADFVTGDTLPINLEKIQEEVKAQEEARLGVPNGKQPSASAVVEGQKSANRERLEAMAKAREDYFRSIGIEPEPEDGAPCPPAVTPVAADANPTGSPSAPAVEEAVMPDSPELPESPAAEPHEDIPAESADAADGETKVETAPDDTERSVEELFAPLEEKLKTQKKKKKHGFLKFLLFLVLLAGLAEASVIGLRQFLPDHEITKTATGIEQTVISEVTTRSLQIKEYVLDVLKGFGIQLGEPEEPEDPLPEPEEEQFNLGALVTVFNKNIKSVTEGPKLGFDSAKTYEIEGLGDMDVITDIDTKEAVYGCLISFNSKWIDYVNGGEDRSCLDLLKTDGAAYRSAANFAKIGQINETFESLVLGEIRANGEQYFTFVREQITVEEEGEVTKRSYSWIYRLEDVAGDIKIVDYTSFE